MKMSIFLKRTPWLVCLAGLGLLLLPGCASTSRWMAKWKTPQDEPSPKLRLAWAQLKESEGNLTEARNAYQKLLKEEPNNAQARLGLARMDVHARRLVEAEQGFQKALKLEPNSPEVLDQVGQFYVDQQQYDKALPLLQRAMQAMPHEKVYRFHLAVALAKAGRAEEALPHFSDTVGEAAGHYNLGRILYDQGQKSDAEQHFVQAVVKNPQLTEAQEWLDELRSGQEPQVQLASGSSLAAPPSSRKVTTNRPTSTGTRPPVKPHGGYEELAPPAE